MVFETVALLEYCVVSKEADDSGKCSVDGMEASMVGSMAFYADFLMVVQLASSEVDDSANELDDEMASRIAGSTVDT